MLLFTVWYCGEIDVNHPDPHLCPTCPEVLALLSPLKLQLLNR
jgi:hypothetical protein